MINIGLIGAGRMGQVRARVISETNLAKLVAVADPREGVAAQIAQPFSAQVYRDWRELITRADIDAVIVATPTMFHVEIASAALMSGKHLLCEKPLARNVAEATKILEMAQASGKILKTGFNYRHLPHVRRAKELINAGAIGKLMFMRCHFGHGGRTGYENEWHTDPRLSGGGVLLEQGIHLMDLMRYLLGEPVRALGQRSTLFWNLAEVEDNCFCIFETEKGQVAQLHVSWTQWINTFDLELYGHDGFMRLQGRDGHYGPPRLTWARRNANHSRPTEEHVQFSIGEDWRDEWSEFVSAIHEKRQPLGNGVDGLRAQQLIEAAYQSAAAACWIPVPPHRRA